MKKSIIVWNEADIIPDYRDRPVLCLMEKGKALTFKEAGTPDNWQWHVQKYHIAYWIYQDEIEILDL